MKMGRWKEKKWVEGIRGRKEEEEWDGERKGREGEKEGSFGPLISMRPGFLFRQFIFQLIVKLSLP